MQYELGASGRQRLWRECCQSIDQHRFDCREVASEKRGRGPLGPTTGSVVIERPAANPARLVVDEPEPGVLRIREVPL
jgi:hypothetical protein